MTGITDITFGSIYPSVSFSQGHANLNVEVKIDGKFGNGFSPSWAGDSTIDMPVWTAGITEPHDPVTFCLRVPTDGVVLADAFEQARLVDAGMANPFNVIVTTRYGSRVIAKETFIDCALAAIDRSDQARVFMELYAMRVSRQFFSEDGKVI